MLTENEVTKLEQRKGLDPKKRADLDYYIVQKIEKRLSELGDIDFALQHVPEKNTKRIITDRMIGAIFRLTEDMLRIAGYVPLNSEPSTDSIYVSRSETPTKIGEDGSLEIVTRISPATEQDFLRAKLLEEHLEKLKTFSEPRTLTGDSPMPEPYFNFVKLLNRTSSDFERCTKPSYTWEKDSKSK